MFKTLINTDTTQVSYEVDQEVKDFGSYLKSETVDFFDNFWDNLKPKFEKTDSRILIQCLGTSVEFFTEE